MPRKYVAFTDHEERNAACAERVRFLMVGDDFPCVLIGVQDLLDVLESGFGGQRDQRFTIEQGSVLGEVRAKQPLDDSVLNALFAAEVHETMRVHVLPVSASAR